MRAEIHNVDDERGIIESCVAGDREAFRLLYAKYADRVYGLAHYMCGDQETTKDLTQQIFLKAFVSLGSFAHGSRFSTWLMRLAVNTCIDHQRKQRNRRLVPIDDIGPQLAASDNSTDDGVLKAEMAARVERAIMSMSRKLKEVVVLKYGADLSYAEISETLGCSIGTVSSRLNRGHAYLAEKLKEFKDHVD